MGSTRHTVQNLFFWPPSLAALIVFAVHVAPASAASAEESKEQVKVAVMVEPGMVYFGIPTLPATRIVPALAKLGIAAQALTAAQVADPKSFNAQRYTVLVMPYGNNFPLPAFENIRAFHRAGGGLVMKGVAFCHPCVPAKPGELDKKHAADKWKDLGHDSKYFAHDDFGMGTGGVGVKTDKDTQFVVVPGNPLGARDEFITSHNSIQGFGGEQIPKEDEVIPLVVARAKDGAEAPLAVLIRHQCERFKGARDVWIGNVVSGVDPMDHYAMAQLIARGAAWRLAEKGLLSKGEFAGALARMDKQEKPAPLPAGLSIVDTPRPWGDTYFPKSNPPAKEMLVVDARRLEKPQRFALICLQGITARRQPRLWLINADKDESILKWHIEGGHVASTKKVDDWRALFKQFASEIKGAVIPDDSINGGVLIAAEVAACEDCVAATPELAKELDLPVKVDLRGRFATYAEAMKWVWDNYKDRINHHLCIVQQPDRAYSGALSYDIEWRGLIFWVTGLRDGDRKGADPDAEKLLAARILSEMPPNIGARGFPGGQGVGMEEGPGVRFLSQYGKGLVASGLTGNMCAMSGVRIDQLKGPALLAPPALEKDKVYIAFTMSDGDNINTFSDYFDKYFQHPAHGVFPMGWGMGPAILDLMPAVAEHYYRLATPNDEFLCDVSGVGYMYPPYYGAAYKDRDKVMEGFMDWTDRYMKRMDMRSVRMHGGSGSADPADLNLDYYARLGAVQFFLPDYGRHATGYDSATFALPDGRPVFRALTGERDAGEGLLPVMRKLTASHRPAFVNAFIHNWTFDMDALRGIYDKRDKDMVFVTPSQLSALYKDARQKGWAK